MKRRRSRGLHDIVELNITAFLNLMVILIPFLLITAVFSRMTVLELSLPAPGQSQQQNNSDQSLDLQVWLYPNGMDVRDAKLGRFKKLEPINLPSKELRELLITLKKRFPDKTSATLWVDPQVPYKQMVAIMDQMRSAHVLNVGTLEEYELFPDITLGKITEPPDQLEGSKSLETSEPLETPAEGVRP